MNDPLVVAISSRALFDFEEENEVFEASQSGEAAYMKLQWDRLDIPAKPGVGFNLCRKLLALNSGGRQHTEVVVLSRNDPISGLRVFKSAESHGLKISRGAFLRGGDPYAYLKPFSARLFLSANPQDVRSAIELDFPAAHVYPRKAEELDTHPNELRIAFDGDSVLFSDQAERVYKREDLDAFMKHEVERIQEPLPAGPFQPFLVALHQLQGVAQESGMAIRTSLVTARGAPAHERALRTLRAWNVSVDEAFFLDGMTKRDVLRVFQPDFFFDDQLSHIDKVKDDVSSGHVPYGIANESPPPHSS